MLSLCEDVILKISELLTDRQKIKLTMICKIMSKFKYKMMYREKIQLHLITGLPYFDNFQRIIILNTKHTTYPKNIKNIYLEPCMDFPINIPVTHLRLGNCFDLSINNCIPSSVIRLTFDTHFNKPLVNIPSSVTHVTFGICFDQYLDGIPSSVTHLTLGWNFNRSIRNKIPQSVTHLTFGGCFNRSIKNNIPSSVTHLTFGCNFNKSIKGNIPPFVTHLRFGKCFNKPIDNSVASRIKIIKK